MTTRSCVLNLTVLLAFSAAQVEALNHRSRHAAEAAAEASASSCPLAEGMVHLCADRPDNAHASDCALCVAGTVLVVAPVGGPGHDLPPSQARLCCFDGVPSSAPDAGPSAPRGPPAA